MKTPKNLMIAGSKKETRVFVLEAGVFGEIVNHSTSHGLCFLVEHDDGSQAYYNPDELIQVHHANWVKRWGNLSSSYRDDCLKIMKRAPRKDGVGILICVGEQLAREAILKDALKKGKRPFDGYCGGCPVASRQCDYCTATETDLELDEI